MICPDCITIWVKESNMVLVILQVGLIEVGPPAVDHLSAPVVEQRFGHITI